MAPSFGQLFTPHPNQWPKKVTITGGILNTHTHPRDLFLDGDGRAECFAPFYDGVYKDVIGIGNTLTPLTTPGRALSQKRKWQSLTTATVHVAGLLTEVTKPEEVIMGYDQVFGDQAFLTMKMFLRAVSNSHGADVDDIRAVIPVLKAMSSRFLSRRANKKKPMVLKIHCERKWTPLGRRIPVIDRERIAIERDLELLLQEVPEAHIEICHVSDGATIDAIRFYQSKGYNVTGEIAPHYGFYCTDDLYEDGNGGTGLNSHVFCLPAFKSAKDKQIILAAMTSGEPWFYFGNDEACHNDDPTLEKGVKTNRSGITVGGQTQLPEAVISYVIEEFIKARREEFLSDFLANNARRFYGLPILNVTQTFRHTPWIVPSTIKKHFEERIEDGVTFPAKTIQCQVAMGGQERLYRLNR